jgi:hypothetical protein
MADEPAQGKGPRLEKVISILGSQFNKNKSCNCLQIEYKVFVVLSAGTGD